MVHLFWIVLHLIFYLLFPEFGASVSLLLYLIFELFSTYKNNGKLEFIHFYFLGTILTIFANLSIIYSFSSGEGVGSYTYALPQYFPIASLIFAIGNQCMAIGYFFKGEGKIPKLVSQAKLSYSLLNKIFWISLLFSFNKFWLPVQLPGSFQILVEIIPIVGIFIFSKYAGKFQGKTLFVQSLILTLGASFNALLFSYLRLDIVSPIIVFILGYYIGTRSLKSFLSVKFVPMFLLLIVFYTFFGLFGANRANVSDGFDRISQLNFEFTDKNLKGLEEEEESLSAFERSSNIAQISATYGLVENHGFYNGKASMPLVGALIPRIFWPDKPKIALGSWFAMEIGAAIEVDGWYNNAVNMTIPGNLFLDFGWYGLVLGSFLIGIFLKLLWNSVGFYDKKFNLVGLFLGVYLFFTGFLGIGADLQILITYLSMYLTLLLLSILINLIHENSLRRANLARK